MNVGMLPTAGTQMKLLLSPQHCGGFRSTAVMLFSFYLFTKITNKYSRCKAIRKNLYTHLPGTG